MFSLFSLFSGLLLVTPMQSTWQSDDTKILNHHQINEHQDVKGLSNVFVSRFHGPYSVDVSEKEKIGDKEYPVIKSGNTVLNNNQDIQWFAERNRASVTIFVKSGDEFVRTSTSLRKEDGKNARGTILEKDSPAYNNLSKGQSFTGKVKVYGREYLAKYDPIKDKSGQVIGAFLVATPEE